ncbi:MAG: hypothetical protein HFP76_01325, partial [Methylococcales symbiont of Iophon sp. n. MRB-2018]
MECTLQFQTILLHFHHPWWANAPYGSGAWNAPYGSGLWNALYCSRQSYCISTILGGQTHLTDLVRGTHPTVLVCGMHSTVPDNLT